MFRGWLLVYYGLDLLLSKLSKAQRKGKFQERHTVLVWPLQLQVAWGHGSTSPQPQPSSPMHTLPPPSLSITLPTCGVGSWSPRPPTPIPSPKHCRSAWKSGDGGGGGIEVKPTEEVGTIDACLISCLLLWHLILFCGFSYSAYLHSAPSPTVLNFPTRLLLWRLVSLSAFSHRACLHSPHSPTALKEWRRHGKKMQLWKYPVK